MNRHLSGSPSAWKLRRETYQKTSGPVSNPNDGRMRKRERRATRRYESRKMLEATP